VKDLASLLPLVLIVGVFYFLILRPQRRRQQSIAATQATLQPGAEVMLSSGIFGRVASLDDETVGLEVAPGTTVTVSRAAVVRVLEPHDDARPASGLDDEDPATGPTDQHP
jgi:preprotein translocase subunit YajC